MALQSRYLRQGNDCGGTSSENIVAISRDCWSAGEDAADAPPAAEPVIHLIDILEEAGPDIARRCYWDFGRYSDLWRIWRAPGSDRPPRSGAITLPVRGSSTAAHSHRVAQQQTSSILPCAVL